MHAKSILAVAGTCAMVAEAKPVGNFFKSIFKRETVMRGTNDIWARANNDGASQATSEITQAFPKCEAALDKLPANQKPHYTKAAGSVTFIKVPQDCTSEVTALKGKTIEGTAFANKGSDIVVSHADPDVLKVFTSHFGFANKPGSPKI